MELEVLKFIKENKKWEEVLSSPPYNISITKSNGLICLKYNQLSSDFSLKIVKECRGIILYEKDLSVAGMAFTKFFNFGEEYADAIDWSTARVTQKMDGSLIKIFYREDVGKWWITTNNSPNAFYCPIGVQSLIIGKERVNNFGELFIKTAKNCGLDYNKLNKENTYIFELCTPYNPVVIRYMDSKIWHIGTRNNKTLNEVEEDIGIEKPKEYFFNNIDDCILCAQKMPDDEEGYVVRDASYNRIKIKSPKYVALHHMINNNVITTRRLIGIIKEKEESEFLNYFPEYKETVSFISNKINSICEYLNKKSNELFALGCKNQKDIAEAIKEINDGFSYFYFLKMKNKDLNPLKYLFGLTERKFVEIIEGWDR